MKRFKIGKIEIDLSYSQIKKLKYLFEDEGDLDMMNKLFLMFREEKLVFNQDNLNKVLEKIRFK
jgi:hypothetical protein